MVFSPTLALKSQWIKGASSKLPQHREEAAGGMTENGDLLLIGGLNKKEKPEASVWLYDAQQKKWNTTKYPPLQQERSSPGCIIIDKKVYVFGGTDKRGNNLKTVEVLDMKKRNRGWTFLPPMKKARAPLAVASVGSTIYVFGSTVPTSDEYNHKIHGSVEGFDIRDRSWNRDRIPLLPKEQQEIAGSVVVQNMIYLVGQNTRMSKAGKEKYKTMVFDPYSSTWVRNKSLPNVTVVKRRGKAVLGSAVLFTYEYQDDISIEKDNIDLNREDIIREAAQNIDKTTTKVAAKAAVKTTGANAGTGTGAAAGAGITGTAVSTTTIVAAVTGTALVVGGVVATSVGISNAGLPSTPGPTVQPTAAPILLPQSADPTPIPTQQITVTPPTSQPQFVSTPAPTITEQTNEPIQTPVSFGSTFTLTIDFPTLSSGVPSYTPSDSPSRTPSFEPSNPPTTSPTPIPTQTPTFSPTKVPTNPPTGRPTLVTTPLPTASPSFLKSSSPTRERSSSPSSVASVNPTFLASFAPTIEVSQSPSLASSMVPSVAASTLPTLEPSYPPSFAPTGQPTGSPSTTPSTMFPSSLPTMMPSLLPSFTPTNIPTIECNGQCDPANQLCIDGLCECIDGFFSPSGRGGRCQDFLECDNSEWNDCHRNADCIEQVGSYDCRCKSGYRGDGRECTDIDECSEEPDICGSNLCINRPGTYECVEPTPLPTRAPTLPPQTFLSALGESCGSDENCEQNDECEFANVCEANVCIQGGTLRFTLTWTGRNNLGIAANTEYGLIWRDTPTTEFPTGELQHQSVPINSGTWVESIVFPPCKIHPGGFEIYVNHYGDAVEGCGTSQAWELMIYLNGNPTNEVPFIGEAEACDPDGSMQNEVTYYDAPETVTDCFDA